MQVECSLGDVVDRVTILELKERKIVDRAKVTNVREELRVLRSAWALAGYPPMDGLSSWAELSDVNGRLWDIEDEIREYERRQDFGPRFIELARSVYHLNDRRAALKREINLALGSALVEEKSYAPYTTRA